METQLVSKNQPEKRFSTGAISAAVWTNEGMDRNSLPTTFRTVTLQRRYKDKEGNWQSTNSLRTGDLPKAVLVLQKAFEYTVLKDDENY